VTPEGEPAVSEPRAGIPSRPDLVPPQGLTTRPGPPAPPPTTGPWGARATWGFWEAVLVGLIGFVGGGIVAALAANPFGRTNLSNLQFVAVGLISEAGLFGAVAGWLYVRHRPAIPALRFDPRRPVDAAIGFGMGLGIYLVAVFGVGLVLTEILNRVSNRSVNAPDQLPNGLHGVSLVLTGVLVLVAAPVAEELFFRGFLFRGLRERHGFWFSGVVSAAIFGAVHYQPAPWQDWLLLCTTLAFVGLGLAGVYEWRRNLIANMAAHCAFNVVGFVLVATGH
jgi:uncharacterized protein